MTTTFYISLNLIKKWLKRNERGISLEICHPEIPLSFCIVDRNCNIEFINDDKLDTVELIVVREITDRRGKKVPIVTLSPHHHQWIEKDGGCYCPTCQKRLWHTPASVPEVEKFEDEFEVIEKMHYTCARCGGRWVQEKKYRKISQEEIDFIQKKVQEADEKVSHWRKVREWLYNRILKYEHWKKGVELESSEGRYRVRWGIYSPVLEKYVCGSYSVLLWNDDDASEQMQKPSLVKGWHWEEVTNPEELKKFKEYLSQASLARERYVKIETLMEKTHEKASPWRTVSRELEELLGNFKWNMVETKELAGRNVLESLLNRIKRFYPEKIGFFQKLLQGEPPESYKGKSPDEIDQELSLDAIRQRQWEIEKEIAKIEMDIYGGHEDPPKEFLISKILGGYRLKPMAFKREIEKLNTKEEIEQFVEKISSGNYDTFWYYMWIEDWDPRSGSSIPIHDKGDGSIWRSVPTAGWTHYIHARDVFMENKEAVKKAALIVGLALKEIEKLKEENKRLEEIKKTLLQSM